MSHSSNPLNRYKYSFDELAMTVVAIPKTGCSSLLNLLAFADEFRRGLSKRTIFGPHEGQLQFPTLKIHNRIHVFQDLGNSTPNFSVHRNVYSRILSAFVDKALMARDPYYFNLLMKEDFFPWSWWAQGDVQHSFEGFLGFLLSHDNAFLGDGHWSPQTRWVSTNNSAETYLDISQALLKTEEAITLAGLELEDFKLKRMNESPSIFRSLAWTQNSIEMSKQLFKMDLEFFNELGLYWLTEEPELFEPKIDSPDSDLALLAIEASSRRDLFFQRKLKNATEKRTVG